MAQPIDGYIERLETSLPTSTESSESLPRRLYPLPGIIEVDGVTRLEGVEYAEPGESWEIGGKEFQAIAFGTPHDPDEDLPAVTKSTHGSVEEEMMYARSYIPARLRTLGQGALYPSSAQTELQPVQQPNSWKHFHEPGLNVKLFL